MAEKWVEFRREGLVRKGNATIDLGKFGRAGDIVFMYGNRKITGYSEVIAGGCAFWPQTIEKWDDGTPASESDRRKITRDLLNMSRDTGIKVEIVQ